MIRDATSLDWPDCRAMLAAVVRPLLRQVQSLGRCLAMLWLASLAGVSLRAAEPGTPVVAGSTNSATVLVIIGAPGEPEFGTNFVRQAGLWEKACQQAGARRTTIGVNDSTATNDLAALKAFLETEPRDGLAELWVVMIGHGTFDGKEARFNLRGPDFSATEMGEWLKPFTRPIVFIDTTSASAPFMAKVAGTNRIVVTATRSGFEQNFARFGQYFAEAVTDPEGDLDQDGQTSVLEAFLRASHRVDDYYKTDGHLATEHPLIDDTGDGHGTPAEWFRGTRATRKAKDGAAVDGFRARQRHLILSPEEQALSPEVRARRDALELEVESFREKRSSMKEDEYFAEIEKRLLELARLRYPAGPDRR